MVWCGAYSGSLMGGRQSTCHPIPSPPQFARPRLQGTPTRHERKARAHTATATRTIRGRLSRHRAPHPATGVSPRFTRRKTQQLTAHRQATGRAQKGATATPDARRGGAPPATTRIHHHARMHGACTHKEGAVRLHTETALAFLSDVHLGNEGALNQCTRKNSKNTP